LGYGYVQYDKQEDAERSIQNLNGKKLGEKELIVEKFVKKQDRLQSVDKKNLYIKNLPLNATKEAIEKIVRDEICQGAVISSYAAILKDGKWAAFACLEDAKAAEQIVEKYQNEPTKLQDAEDNLCVVYHESKQERLKKLSMQHQKETNETNLYVKNLKLTTKKEELFNAFIQFGPITSVDVKLWNSPNGKQAVFGFINFKSKEDATRARSEALTKDEVKNLYIPTEPQYINLHQSKEKRNEFIQSKKRAKNSLNPFMPPYRFDPYMMQAGMQNNRRFGAYPANNFYPPRQGQQQRGPMHTGGMNRAGPDGQRGFGGPQQQRGGFQNKQQQPYNRGPQQGTRQPMGGNNMGGQKPYNNPNMSNQKKPEINKQAQPKPQPQQQQAPQSTASVVNVSSLKTKLNEFLGQSQDKQRQILGELLFPKVRARTTEVMAPKITGMLIDLSVLEVAEILEFLEDESLLNERIQEAKELIESGDA
jgi:polyadenylate-binding protein